MRSNFAFLLGFTLVIGVFSTTARAQSTGYSSTALKVGSKEVKIDCEGDSAGILRDKAGSLKFVSYMSRLKAIKKKYKKTRKSSMKKKMKKLRQLHRKGGQACALITSPAPAVEKPTTPPPVQAGGAYFDSSGTLTETGRIVLGIPVGLTGDIVKGKEVWTANCVGCHVERREFTFNELRASVSKSPMFYTTERLSDADLAQIMVYLSRFRRP